MLCQMHGWRERAWCWGGFYSRIAYFQLGLWISANSVANINKAKSLQRAESNLLSDENYTLGTKYCNIFFSVYIRNVDKQRRQLMNCNFMQFLYFWRDTSKLIKFSKLNMSSIPFDAFSPHSAFTIISSIPVFNSSIYSIQK